MPDFFLKSYSDGPGAVHLNVPHSDVCGSGRGMDFKKLYTSVCTLKNVVLKGGGGAFVKKTKCTYNISENI